MYAFCQFWPVVYKFYAHLIFFHLSWFLIFSDNEKSSVSTSENNLLQQFKRNGGTLLSKTTKNCWPTKVSQNGILLIINDPFVCLNASKQMCKVISYSGCLCQQSEFCSTSLKLLTKYQFVWPPNMPACLNEVRECCVEQWIRIMRSVHFNFLASLNILWMR